MLQLRVLVRRNLARLAGNRSIAVGAAICVLLLALLALGTYMRVESATVPEGALGGAVRSAAWQVSGSFDTFLVIMGIVLGSLIVSDDLKSGTLYGILARPVARSIVFLSGWLAAALLLLTFDAARSGGIVLATVLAGGGLELAYLLGVVAKASGSLLYLTLFAAIASRLSAGSAVAIGLIGTIAASLAFNQRIPFSARIPLTGLAFVWPLPFLQEDVVTQTLVGGSHDIAALAEIIAYRTGWTVLLLAAACWLFERREMAPRI